jgi:hypothetical protein
MKFWNRYLSRIIIEIFMNTQYWTVKIHNLTSCLPEIYFNWCWEHRNFRGGMVSIHPSQISDKITIWPFSDRRIFFLSCTDPTTRKVEFENLRETVYPLSQQTRYQVIGSLLPCRQPYFMPSSSHDLWIRIFHVRPLSDFQNIKSQHFSSFLSIFIYNFPYN